MIKLNQLMNYQIIGYNFKKFKKYTATLNLYSNNEVEKIKGFMYLVNIYFYLIKYITDD